MQKQTTAAELCTKLITLDRIELDNSILGYFFNNIPKDCTVPEEDIIKFYNDHYAKSSYAEEDGCINRRDFSFCLNDKPKITATILLEDGIINTYTLQLIARSLHKRFYLFSGDIPSEKIICIKI